METEHGRLLVVDDNEMNRDMLSRRLSRQGHTVEVAADGLRALELIDQEAYDVILLDIMMPGIDGYQVLEQLRARHAPADLPVIMATAKDHSEDVVKALQMGANDYVTKPLDFTVVLARVQTQLSLKKSRQALVEAYGRMKRDLDAAARFQRSMLPSSLPPTDKVRFAWRYEPCDELAGDALNFIKLDDRHVCVYLIDVCGHGVPASLLSVSINRTLSTTTDESSLLTRPCSDPPGFAIASPAAVASRLNTLFPMANNDQLYFTMILGILDTVTGRMRLVNAGHPWPLHIARGERVLSLDLDAGSYPIGMVADAQYQELVVDLRPGERLYLYSDGLVEALNENEEEFGEQRLQQTAQAALEQSLDHSLDLMIQKVALWRGGRPFVDDLSILAIEIPGP
jgi:sigma-B regulation protein RsbU (phosphoserine phosphatase)